MNRYILFKLVVSTVLVGSYFFLPKYGFTSFCPTLPVGRDIIAAHLLYPLSHASIFHLAGNILCLWLLHCPLHLFITYTIAGIASFLPSFSLYDCIANGGFHALSEPTYGFSGVLFAMVGISWGRIRRFRLMLSRNKWIIIIPAFIPHLNFLIHLYCLLIGYLYGYLLSPPPSSGIRHPSPSPPSSGIRRLS